MEFHATDLSRMAGLAALLAFVLSMVSTEAMHGEEGGGHDGEEVAASHPGDCPDGMPDGVPCSSSCACLCCPGHARTLPAAEKAQAVPPRGYSGALSERADLLHPEEIVFGIFRPPRAA